MAEFVYFGENFLPYRIAFRGLKVRTQILSLCDGELFINFYQPEGHTSKTQSNIKRFQYGAVGSLERKVRTSSQEVVIVQKMYHCVTSYTNLYGISLR